MNLREADAEVAKSTGGMVGLWPTAESAAALAIPSGEPVDDLHLTMYYFGEDVTDLNGYAAQLAVAEAAERCAVIEAKAFGHATFNPEGDDPCRVYIVGGDPQLQPLQRIIQETMEGLYESRDQHTPWIPHVTGFYESSIAAHDLIYSGPVTFDRLVLKWAGESFEYTLGDLG